jgi:hypothetical protein
MAIWNGGGDWGSAISKTRQNWTRPSHVHFVRPNVTRKARDVTSMAYARSAARASGSQ